MLLLPVLSLLSLCAATPSPPLPLWHTQFSTDFNETVGIPILGLKRSTHGQWWYDAVAQAEVVDRVNGQYDRYCGSIHPLITTPCRHLVTRGNRYLIFPQLRQCCLCCVAAQGCGILSPTWLDDAEYQGEVMLRGQRARKWSKSGLQPNVYYASADEAQVPLELDQEPNDLQSFDPDTFRTDPVPPELLVAPDYCKDRCPLTSVCTFLGSHGEARGGLSGGAGARRGMIKQEA